MFIMTLVFENFGENITKKFWGCLLFTNEENGFLDGLGGQMTVALEDNNKAKGKSDLIRT